jgi:hypothetical protein
LELEPRIAAPAHATGAVEFVPLSSLVDDDTFRLRDEGDVAALAASIGRLGQLAPVELRPMPAAPAGGPRFQVVAGFRRIAALRLLFRERVLARVHRTLDDDDAWGIALGNALLTEPLDRNAVRALDERLAGSGAAPWADELLEEALVRAPVEPELRERFFEFLADAPAAADDGAGPGEPVDDETEPLEDDGEADGLAEDEPEDGAPETEGGDDTIRVTPEELVDDLTARLYGVNADLAVAAEAWRDLPSEGRRAILEQARWLAALLPELEAEEDEDR